MATKKSETKVTRISATDKGTEKPKRVAKTAKSVAKTTPSKQRSFGLLGKFLAYFKGAWFELRQVHWPTRRATWGLTGAVLLFSAFFVVFITTLDAGFKFLFEQILK